MLPEERLEKIIALLQEKKTIDNESLCSLLDVSISTVKRDLDLLEKRRVLRRTRGGAVLTKQANVYTSEVSYDVEAEAMAKAAEELIFDEDRIFLSGNGMNFVLAHNIASRFRGIVYTNNINIMLEFLQQSPATVILLGGKVMLRHGSMDTDVSPVVANLDDVFVDKAFVQPHGLSLRHGFFINTLEEKHLYDTLKKNAMHLYGIASNSTCDHVDRYHLGGLDYFSDLILAGNTPAGYGEALMEAGVNIIRSL